jgi:hypothetical protein
LFAFILSFYVFVECYDVYWSIKLQDTLYGDEVNPFGRFLIDLDDGSVALFMAFKVSALAVLVSSLPILCFFRPRLAWVLLVIAGLSRVCLLLFLEFGHLIC